MPLDVEKSHQNEVEEIECGNFKWYFPISRLLKFLALFWSFLFRGKTNYQLCIQCSLIRVHIEYGIPTEDEYDNFANEI